MIAAAKQDRVSVNETRDRRLHHRCVFTARIRSPAGGAVSTITVRLDNATNELYRNHLSLIKDCRPWRWGGNFKVVYGVRVLVPSFARTDASLRLAPS